MRVDAHQSGGDRFPRRWPAGFAAACVVLVAAGVYFSVSLMQALDRAGHESTFELPSLVTGAIDGDRPGAPAPDATVEALPELPLPAGVVAPSPSATLLARIEDATGDGRDHVSVSVKRLTDGTSASFGGAIRYYAASTFKLAVLYEAAVRLSDGRLSLDDRIVMSDEDAAEDLGTSAFLHFEDDGSITVRNLLGPMIEVSDNSSAVTLMHAFGSGTIDETLRGRGIETMTVNRTELWTTADDLARLMEAIYSGEQMTTEVRDYVRGLLLAQTIRSGIPAALATEISEGLRVGNKTGTWEAAQHDVAFVEAPTGTYVIAILTDGSYEGWEAIHRVTQIVQQELAKQP